MSGRGIERAGNIDDFERFMRYLDQNTTEEDMDLETDDNTNPMELQLTRANAEILRQQARRIEEKLNFEKQLESLTSEIDKLKRNQSTPSSHSSGSSGGDATSQALNSIGFALHKQAEVFKSMTESLQEVCRQTVLMYGV